jgi:hypothetical protein
MITEVSDLQPENAPLAICFMLFGIVYAPEYEVGIKAKQCIL